MLGNPKFKVNDRVKFRIIVNGVKEEMEGVVAIVHSYGTFFQNEEPSYDIVVEHFLGGLGGEKTLVKHIVESDVVG